MQIDLTDTGLRPASGQDWREVADITAEAFRNDPVINWVFGPHRALLTTFRIMARDLYLKQGFSHIHDAGGATMWLPPEQAADLPFLSKLKFAIGLARHAKPGALKRALEMGERMDAHHPKDPHMYLFTIGTRESARGKGVGKALLAPVLSYCDREGIPAYLENSNPDNTGFYAAHGFERIGLFEVGEEGSPVMEPMWREAKGQI